MTQQGSMQGAPTPRAAVGIAIAKAAGCLVSDLAGNPLNTSRGLIVSADEATQRAVLALVEPHLAAVTKAV